jgi:hypothetical protein
VRLFFYPAQQEIPFPDDYSSEAKLKASKGEVQVMEKLDHMQEFTEIDRVLPRMLAFTRAQGDAKI